MASTLVTNKRSKHINLRCKMIQDHIAKGLSKLENVRNSLNVTRIMTKGLDEIKHRQFTIMILQGVW